MSLTTIVLFLIANLKVHEGNLVSKSDSIPVAIVKPSPRSRNEATLKGKASIPIDNPVQEETMIELDCQEVLNGCSFKTKKLPFNQAEIVLQRHMFEKHPVGFPHSNHGQEKKPVSKRNSVQLDNSLFQRNSIPGSHLLRRSYSGPRHKSLTGASVSRSGPGYVKLSGMIWTATEEDVRNLLRKEQNHKKLN